jgi:pilus assembly protein CpaB
MNRNTRTLIVLAVALVAASIATFGVYQAIRSMPVREVEVAHKFVVVAARAMPAGTKVTEGDVRLAPWPERSMIPGAFEKIDQVANRGLVAPLLENEPLAEAKLAPIEAGAGLPPTITPGMRAISVRVNEVVGVAGFVTPGTRVDVLVTLKQNENNSLTRVVVSNVQVLTAGTRYEQAKDKPEAIPSSVVTLLLAPADAERVVLAANDGQIMLALRNPLDVESTATPGTRLASLFGEAPPPAPARAAASRPKAPVVQPPPPPPVAQAPPPPKVYSVEAIRGAKRSEETVK